MGPRLFNRGKTRRRRYNSEPTRSFNGAAVIQPRKMQDAAERIRPDDPPSMGPRLFNRGKGFGGPVVFCGHGPSMGPRLFNRGKGGPQPCPGGQGQAFNGAAVIQPRKNRQRNGRRTVALGLQWGRGYSTAENREPDPRSWASIDTPSMGPRLFNRGKTSGVGVSDAQEPSFNGAAVIQPRKTGSASGGWSAAVAAFNGAAVIQPRKNSAAKPLPPRKR